MTISTGDLGYWWHLVLATTPQPATPTVGRVVLIVGTRPESIKLAPIAEQLGDDAIVVHTGQHHSLAMIQPSRHGRTVTLPPLHPTSRGDQLGRTITALDSLYARLRPQVVIVQGDTTSAVAGALAANTRNIPLVHVEAGLRSFDRSMPEEHNRILIDHLADLCCAPTPLAVTHLQREGLPDRRIVLTGNPVVEAATHALPEMDRRLAILDEFGVGDNSYVLATIHRPENVDDDTNLTAILHALAQSPLPVLLPVHPRLRSHLAPHTAMLVNTHVQLTTPQPYPQLLALAQHARLIVTDSGGLQEEATILKRPIIVVRRSNERPEVEGKFGQRVTPTALLSILSARINELHDVEYLKSIPSPYGDGNAAARIAAATRHLRRMCSSESG
ncbi:MAG: non-hydrolyzing UDP-N-acetylglucosamine 2-epimerase, partial [Actinomycetes bacterium]